MLIAMAQQGKFLEAIQEFYAEDATMQENNQSPRVGLAALLENERRVLLRSKRYASTGRTRLLWMETALRLTGCTTSLIPKAASFGGMNWHIKFGATARSSANDSFTPASQRRNSRLDLFRGQWKHAEENSGSKPSEWAAEDRTSLA